VSFDGFVPGCPDPKLPFDHYSTLEWQVNRKCTKLDEAQRNITGHCDRRGRKATPIATTADTHLSCAATKEGAVIASTRLREKKGRMGAKHFIKRVSHNGGKGTSKSSDRIFSLMPHGVDDSHQPSPPDPRANRQTVKSYCQDVSGSHRPFWLFAPPRPHPPTTLSKLIDKRRNCYFSCA